MSQTMARAEQLLNPETCKASRVVSMQLDRKKVEEN
jgi:hypothetical protein